MLGTLISIQDWIKSRDDPEGNPTDQESSAAPTKDILTVSAAAAGLKTNYLPVPSEQDLAKQPCPICQERFDTIWNDETQDFVWMDAIRIGSKVYHVTCHEDLKKEGRSTPGRTGTPDSVLGKRKAVSAAARDAWAMD